MNNDSVNKIVEKVYKHPFITCMLISSVCGSIATLVNAFKKED